MSTKNERITARTTEHVKELVELASNLRGLSITDFVTDSVEREARQIIKDYKVLELSKRDSKAFVKTLKNPPDPNDNLKEAAEVHEELIGE